MLLRILFALAISISPVLAQSITPQIGGGISKGFDGGINSGGGSLAPYLGQVATRTVFPNCFTTGNQQFNSRSRHKASDNITSLQILLPNWYVDGNVVGGSTFAELATGAVSTVTASIEFPAATFTQVKFSGSATGSVPNGGNLLSDAVSVTIPKGSFFYVRIFLNNSVGIMLYGVSNSTPGNDLGADRGQGEAIVASASGQSDLTMGGTLVDATSGDFGFRPIAIIGQTALPSVLILGDSRAAGALDTPDATGDVGEVARTIGNAFAYTNGGIPADRANKFVASHTKRISIGQYFSHVYSQYGVNDIDLDIRTAAQVLADNQSIGGYFAGKPFFLQTVSPHSNGSNAAPADATANTSRISYNTTLRAGGIAGVTAAFDVASITESSLNSGLWTTGYSTDFLHANSTGTAAVKAAGVINTALIHR